MDLCDAIEKVIEAGLEVTNDRGGHVGKVGEVYVHMTADRNTATWGHAAVAVASFLNECDLAAHA